MHLVSIQPPGGQVWWYRITLWKKNTKRFNFSFGISVETTLPYFSANIHICHLGLRKWTTQAFSHFSFIQYRQPNQIAVIRGGWPGPSFWLASDIRGFLLINLLPSLLGYNWVRGRGRHSSLTCILWTRPDPPVVLLHNKINQRQIKLKI